ncbi:hypothetical protein OPT61_g5677 [Boeremia exigua]|uniref:Uncharacterized protein n=1 Tax=Boeremia exigua TaxID=749465 RepID=A0ACC2I9E8_9PLEO|nr:hypothetical protein OPT61_g5677 [Boeremia exigua]
MEGKSAASAVQLRKRDAFKTPNPSKPAGKAATVSAAGPFKARKLDTPPLQPSSRAQKSTTKRRHREEKEEVHPLALAFKEKSQEYRQHLYSTAEAKINKDLNTLLSRLYESNLQAASPGPAEDDQASPLRLTVPAKYQRLVENLCRPLSSYRYNLQRTTPSGETERFQTTLHDRFQAFEDRVRAETEQIKELQRQWEGVVTEIFQLGVVCLGEADMAGLLSTADGGLAASKAAAPGHDGPAVKDKGKRKHVSFASPDLMALFPDFLFAVSEPQKAVSAAPVVSVEGVQRFEKEIAGLGQQHGAELRRLEMEHKAWWERKQRQLAKTLMEE